LASCKSTIDIYESDIKSLTQERSNIIKDARSLIGSSYKYAGNGPKNFDCSGLVGYVYNRADLVAEGSSSHLSKMGEKIKKQEVRPGDLVFFKRKGKVFHVSIISKINEGELWVVHSTSSRGVIEEDVMASSYWRPLIYKTVSLRSYR